MSYTVKSPDYLPFCLLCAEREALANVEKARRDRDKARSKRRTEAVAQIVNAGGMALLILVAVSCVAWGWLFALHQLGVI